MDVDLVLCVGGQMLSSTSTLIFIGWCQVVAQMLEPTAFWQVVTVSALSWMNKHLATPAACFLLFGAVLQIPPHLHNWKTSVNRLLI